MDVVELEMSSLPTDKSEPTVVSVAWLPGSETQLAVACAHYVRIFDLAVADRAVVNLRILGTVVCTYTLCMPDSSTGVEGAACSGATIEDMALLPPKLLAMNTAVAATNKVLMELPCGVPLACDTPRAFVLINAELEQLAAALTTTVVVLTSTGELMAHGIPYSTVLLDVGSGAAAVAQQQQQQQQQPQLPARSCTIEHTLSLPDYVQVPQGGSLSELETTSSYIDSKDCHSQLYYCALSPCACVLLTRADGSQRGSLHFCTDSGLLLYSWTSGVPLALRTDGSGSAAAVTGGFKLLPSTTSTAAACTSWRDWGWHAAADHSTSGSLLCVSQRSGGLSSKVLAMNVSTIGGLHVQIQELQWTGGTATSSYNSSATGAVVGSCVCSLRSSDANTYDTYDSSSNMQQHVSEWPSYAVLVLYADGTLQCYKPADATGFIAGATAATSTATTAGATATDTTAADNTDGRDSAAALKALAATESSERLLQRTGQAMPSSVTSVASSASRSSATAATTVTASVDDCSGSELVSGLPVLPLDAFERLTDSTDASSLTFSGNCALAFSLTDVSSTYKCALSHVCVMISAAAVSILEVLEVACLCELYQ
eukprot:11992-Heterococcus_DN1.PRE.1